METLHFLATNFNPEHTTTFSIPSNTRIDVDGFLAWVHMKQDLQYIKTLEIAGDVLSNLYSVVIGNDACHWNDVVRLVHRMSHLESIDCSRSTASPELFSVMLEDLLQLMAPSMLNFKRFCVSRRVSCGYLSAERRQLLMMSIPSSVEEFVVTDVLFREPARHEQGSIIADQLGVILSSLTNLKRIWIQQPAFWRDVPSVLSSSNLQMIFRNRSLQHVVLRNMALTDDDLEFIADELIRNCTLETMDLSGWNRTRSTRGYESILRVMEHQFYVKEFKLFTSDWRYTRYHVSDLMVQQWEFIARGIDSFTKLNAANRRRIFRDERSTREDLFQLVDMVQDDPNATFTIFRSHPRILWSS